MLLGLILCAWSLVEVAGHDPGAFTQGLELRGGILYESTGIYGQSTIRRVNPETGEVLRTYRLPDSLFAEGLTFVSSSRMMVLTWREGIVLAINPSTFEVTETLEIAGEGWGLCYDGSSLIRSDGSSLLRFHDPGTMAVTDSVTVTLSGAPQNNLNELEYARGLVWANQLLSTRILAIDPATGDVLATIDLASLAPPGAGNMNGIAYDRENDLFIITGKNWPVMYTLDISF